ncbi:hypothetical protein [Hahella ganghwensis]|uniref:hypothetical protein n=1 Tax=Hahella ganghwensis TaxID=286420 RepID=UPI00036B7738|nr:hypothetical protein [Hahella ganghwensis]
MKTVTAACLLIATMFSTTAFAGSCPLIMKDIDKAMTQTTLDAKTKAQVMELRQKGEELHKSGDHGGSVKALNKAKALLQSQ